MAGVLAVSDAMTAYPSIADLSNGGIFMSDETSSARTHARESASGSVTTSRGGTSLKISSLAWATVSIE